jgi:mRNA interferase MazF
LSVDSLLVCIEPMTFDKARLSKYLGQLESEYLHQMQAVLKRYLVF